MYSAYSLLGLIRPYLSQECSLTGKLQEEQFRTKLIGYEQKTITPAFLRREI